MKRLLTLTFFVGLLVSCSKKPVAPYVEPVYSKKITFVVGTLEDYSSPAFNNSYAEVYLSLNKMNVNGTATALLWDTTFAKRKLDQYPLPAQPLIIEKNFGGIRDSKERVFVSYIKRYDTNGKKQEVASGQNCPAESSNFTADVKL